MKEDYVSFKIAKLLKENRFDWKCLDWYSTKGNLYYYADSFEKDLDGIDELCSAPTLQVAMKWLREVHKLFIEIDYELYSNVNQEDENEKYQYGIAIKFIKQKEFEEVKRLVLNTLYNTYEDAAMDAIKYCLTKLL